MKKLVALLLALCLVLMVGCGASDESSTPSSTTKITIPDEIPTYFVLKGGSGTWDTTLILNKDGSYSGRYLELLNQEYIDNLLRKNYRIADYSGNFNGIEKVDEYTYKLTLGTYSTMYMTGEEWDEEYSHYFTTEAEGFFGCEEFMLYLPGKPASELDEKFLMWVPEKVKSGELNCYAIHNTVDGYGFVNE